MCFLLFLGTGANAQQNPVSTSPLDDTTTQAESPDPMEDIPPEVLKVGNELKAKYEKSHREYAEVLANMRESHILYMNEEDRTDSRMKQYREERNKALDLMDQLFLEALDVIRVMPDRECATYLVTLIEHRLLRDFYDEAMMEAGARLIDGGVKLPYLFQATARAAVVGGDFDMARKLYEVVDIESEEVPDCDRSLFYNMDELQKQWEQEQQARRNDAEKDTNPRVRMMTTRGEVVMELFIDQAPSTVANFINLVESGYYDGLDFGQVIDHLLALTGDLTGDGRGNSGKFIMDEHQREDARHAFAGSLVMAKAPTSVAGQFVPNSASAQFAILFLPLVGLNEDQTVFGRVIQGMDSICELRRIDPNKKKDKKVIVLPPDRVLSIEVIRRPETLPDVNYNEHFGHNHGPGVTH